MIGPIRYIYDDVDRQWPFHDKNHDGDLSWEEYEDTAFGRVDSK